MIGVDVFNILSDRKAVSDIVGRNIFPNDASARETPMPCLIYELQNLSMDSTYDQEGTIDLAEIDLVVHCIAKTYRDVQALYAAVMLALVDYKGGRIDGMKHDSSSEDSFFNPNTDEIQYYKVDVTFKVWFNWRQQEIA